MPADLDSPVLVRLEAIETLAYRVSVGSKGKRGAWGRQTEGGGLYARGRGSMTK